MYLFSLACLMGIAWFAAIYPASLDKWFVASHPVISSTNWLEQSCGHS